jgi:phosphohistidine phosphatase SixA
LPDLGIILFYQENMSRYLVFRHAEDQGRKLTTWWVLASQEKWRKISKTWIFLERISNKVYRIITSEYPRAIETGKWIADSLWMIWMSTDTVYKTPYLNPDANFDLAIEYINSLPDSMITIIVTHLPNIYPLSVKLWYKWKESSGFGYLQWLDFEEDMPKKIVLREEKPVLVENLLQEEDPDFFEEESFEEIEQEIFEDGTEIDYLTLQESFLKGFEIVDRPYDIYYEDVLESWKWEFISEIGDDEFFWVIEDFVILHEDPVFETERKEYLDFCFDDVDYDSCELCNEEDLEEISQDKWYIEVLLEDWDENDYYENQDTEELEELFLFGFSRVEGDLCEEEFCSDEDLENVHEEFLEYWMTYDQDSDVLDDEDPELIEAIFFDIDCTHPEDICKDETNKIKIELWEFKKLLLWAPNEYTDRFVQLMKSLISNKKRLSNEDVRDYIDTFLSDWYVDVISIYHEWTIEHLEILFTNIKSKEPNKSWQDLYNFYMELPWIIEDIRVNWKKYSREEILQQESFLERNPTFMRDNEKNPFG